MGQSKYWSVSSSPGKIVLTVQNLNPEVRLNKLAVRRLAGTRIIQKPREVRFVGVSSVNKMVLAHNVVDGHA